MENWITSLLNSASVMSWRKWRIWTTDQFKFNYSIIWLWAFIFRSASLQRCNFQANASVMKANTSSKEQRGFTSEPSLTNVPFIMLTWIIHTETHMKLELRVIYLVAHDEKNFGIVLWKLGIKKHEVVILTRKKKHKGHSGFLPPTDPEPKPFTC